MDSIQPNESICTEAVNRNSGSSDYSPDSCKMVKNDISFIKKELSTSLMLIQSSLTSLDIEAAHLLNPLGLKITNGTESLTRQKKSRLNHSTIRSRINIPYPMQSSSIAELEEAVEETQSLAKTLRPPDLKFSFYSTKKDILSSAALLTPEYSYHLSKLTLETSLKELDQASNKTLSSESESESRTNDQKEQSEFTLENASDKLLTTCAKSKPDVTDAIEMQDLVESLSNIHSALDTLEREAAHFLNPPGSNSLSTIHQ